jgi:hypothetical protein
MIENHQQLALLAIFSIFRLGRPHFLGSSLLKAASPA